MGALGDTPERSSRTVPGPADIRLVIAGTVGVLVGVFADPVSRQTAPSPLAHWIAMPLMVVVFSALVALPAFVFRGRRGDWRGFTAWYGKGLLILTGLLLVGHVRRAMNDSPPALLEALKAGRVTIDRFLRAERAAAPVLFDQQLVMRLERGLKILDPSLSKVALAGVTDGEAWMRAHLTYVTAPGVPDQSRATSGHIAIYYHSSGMAVLGATCLEPADGCQPLSSLLAAAEQALRERLASSDLEGVLPESEDCSTDAIQLTGGERHGPVRMCAYGPSLQLTFTRLGPAATIESLIAERTGG